MNPLISIITPTYNRIEYIEETISSVINQTYTNWEYIIVDDGSDKENYDYIKNQANRDGRITVVKRNKSPKGASHCRNIGALELAIGEFVIFLDSDDLLLPKSLEKRVELSSEFPNKDFWIFATNVFYNDEGIDKSFSYLSNFDESHIYTFLKHISPQPWYIMSSFWKKETLFKLKGFDINFIKFQDPEIHTRAILKGFRYKYFKDYSYDNLYRWEKGKSNTNSTLILSSSLLYIKKMMKIINESEYENNKNVFTSLRHMYVTQYRLNKFKNTDTNILEKLFVFALNKENKLFCCRRIGLIIINKLSNPLLLKIPVYRGVIWRLWMLLV